MAKFVYKMAGVLDIKLKMEDQAKSAFALAMKALRDEEELRDALIRRKEDYVEEGRRMRSSSLNVMDLRDNKLAIDNLKEQIANQQLRVDEAAKRVENARIKLQNAMEERKIQEKLRDNAFEEFKKELSRQESKEIDELVSYRFGAAAVKTHEEPKAEL